MSFFGDGALPLGMVFFAGLVFGVLRRKSGHRAAARGYPDLATRLGLTYKPSSYRSGVGSLVGTYQGFVVIVDPDEQRRIRVRFEGAPAVDLRTYERDSGPPKTMRTVFTRDKRFDGFFKTRWAAERERATLESLEEPGTLVAPFRRLRQLKELSVTSVGVSAVFDFGNPPYIPVAIIEELLPALVALAALFEEPPFEEAQGEAAGT